jgi:hypothetical protein
MRGHLRSPADELRGGRGDTLVVYRSKDGGEWKVFHTLQWLAAKCAQVPNKGEQRVPCYGDYSNVSRRKRNT